MSEKDLDYEYPNMLEFVLAREGGYVNRKTDRGGPTNKGVTQVTYNSYRRSKDLPTKDVKDITQQEVENNPEQKEYLKGWLNRVDHLKDYANTVLPKERKLPYQLGIEMDVAQDGNIIYYYEMDDYRNMDRDDFKRNFPKILQQTIHQVGHPTGGAANVSKPEGCAGTYHVRGYVRSDGVKVSGYERTRGAKHLGKQTLRYRGLRIDQMTNEEIDELLDEYI